MPNYKIGTESGSITTATTGTSWTYDDVCTEPITISTPFVYPTPLNNNKKGDDDMRFLYEVILVNPKNDTFYVNQVIARSETSALMIVYEQYKGGFVGTDTCIPFDDLKTSCRVLMEWKKEKSLKKAIETIKEAVE